MKCLDDLSVQKTKSLALPRKRNIDVLTKSAKTASFDQQLLTNVALHHQLWQKDSDEWQQRFTTKTVIAVFLLVCASATFKTFCLKIAATNQCSGWELCLFVTGSGLLLHCEVFNP